MSSDRARLNRVQVHRSKGLVVDVVERVLEPAAFVSVQHDVVFIVRIIASVSIRIQASLLLQDLLDRVRAARVSDYI